MTRFLLFLAYFLLATPAGLASRLLHDPLARRRDRRAATYWTAPVTTPARAPARRGEARP